jgi:hypothetical protein
MSEYIDFATAKDLTSAITYLYDPDSTREPGNILRYILLEQVTSEECLLTAYMIGNAWFQRKLSGFGVVGSKFLLDGEDIKNRLNNDVWRRHGLRLIATNRNAVILECVNGRNDNIESQTYSGDADLFEVPPVDWQVLTRLTDGWEFRRACNYINTFSKCKGDTNGRVVWLKAYSYDTVGVYCTEYTGKSGISYILSETKRFSAEDVIINFGIAARHLPKLQTVFNETPEITVFVDNLDYPNVVKFSGDAGFIILPTIEANQCKTVSDTAPKVLGNPASLVVQHEAQRIFDLKEFYESLLIQVPKKSADSEDILLSDLEGTKLSITKLGDILKLEESSVSYAAPEGLDDEWYTIIVNFNYLKKCLETMLKHAKDQEAQQSYDTVDYDTDFPEDFDEWALPAPTEQKSLFTITQAYLKQTNRWCLYIDPVPYTDSCRTFLSARVPKEVTDRLTGQS